MEQFTVNVDNKEYTIIPLEEKDQILYEVHDNKMLCLIGKNDNAEWEANCEFDESIVNKIGVAIESLDM